ncbi:MAG TPA: hypothetical protein VF532_05845 [Candidatus Angelobacter sp.]
MEAVAVEQQQAEPSPQPQAQATEKTVLLPLDQPRVISIRDGKFTYTFHFGRITQADWELYFNSIHWTSKNDGSSQVQTFDVDTPGVELFERKLVKTEGYAGTELKKEDFWKIPPRHSNPVAWLLRTCAVADEGEDQPFNPELVEVRLNAIWSVLPGDAAATMFKGLVHRFAPPSPEQKKRVYRAGAMSKIVGGSRSGTTVHGSRHKILLELYDQLIQSVDGYSCGATAFGGVSAAFGADRAAIVREMDALHKFTAAQQLFLGGASAASSDDKEGA